MAMRTRRTRRTWRRALELQRQVRSPLLPASARPLAVALLVACVALTVFLAGWYTHQTRAGWLDAAIDIRVQALLGGHPAVASLVRLGNPIPVTMMTALLVTACLATRRWRAAVLVAIAVSGAGALTELLLKPLVRRTFTGELSFPSGRATGVFALAVAFAILLVDPPGPRMPAYLRVLLALAALLAASIVAVATVGVHYHYATDTVGGAAVATTTVLLTALVVDRIPKRR